MQRIRNMQRMNIILIVYSSMLTWSRGCFGQLATFGELPFSVFKSPISSGEWTRIQPKELDTADFRQIGKDRLQCSQFSQDVLANLEASLQADTSLHVGQGHIDFGFVARGCEPRCFVNNPSSPYGVLFMPLAPEEDLQRKATAVTTLPAVSSYLRDPQSGGQAPVWQLRKDEVVVVAGCTPPVDVSRVFSATGYVFAKRGPAGRWVEVFGSTGDSVGMYQGKGGHGVANRMNTTRLETITHDPSRGKRKLRNHSGSSSHMVGDKSAAQREPYDAFTVLVMGATPETIQYTMRLLAATLDAQGIPAGKTLNVLPIPGPVFSDHIGLDAGANYYTMLLRNVLPGGKLPVFQEYLGSHPLRAWRLTPRHPCQGTGMCSYSSFPIPQVLPRRRSGLPNERALQPAFNYLLNQVSEAYRTQGYTVTGSMITAPALPPIVGEWGLGCVQRSLPVCNGDSRDVTYITDLPLKRMDSPGQAIIVIGVNHHQSGMAAYSNVATVDPIRKRGLAAFDDVDMVGTAAPFLKGSQYEDVGDKLFVVAFARNCTGHVQGCMEIPTSGATGVANGGFIFVLHRAVINPNTGVGPDTSDMVLFKSFTMTPRRLMLG